MSDEYSVTIPVKLAEDLTDARRIANPDKHQGDLNMLALYVVSSERTVITDMPYGTTFTAYRVNSVYRERFIRIGGPIEPLVNVGTGVKTLSSAIRVDTIQNVTPPPSTAVAE
jgi:hypothetical protein